MSLTHKFNKTEWASKEAKKKAGKDGLSATQMNMNAVPALRDAVKLLMDSQGVKYA